MTQIQLFSKIDPFFITWNININNIKINDVITIKNEKQKINGYKELLSNLIIGKLANYSKNLFEYYEFKNFIDKINLPYSQHAKITKKYFNNIPYFKFKVIDIYKINNNDILVLDPIDGNYII
jgi:hypothetical protein